MYVRCVAEYLEQGLNDCVWGRFRSRGLDSPWLSYSGLSIRSSTLGKVQKRVFRSTLRVM